ncbi:hypothetical protein [Conexibacter woesei]|uniref:Uncharacterized protein n=1 Tax=Conexibacter woesei (strain DSM 14684 / CCUG 47730 / CIP 108061 / JCM 11494 / NBRC 100937 / ID131577) TaxID=469383 RepID=D3FC78_CONWI|nr:hypothetical protein [Conexibacter woesei]ADB53373.1 hypothetical protein Cwoe_4962 [Conexibacter woesei DSM 14684]
MIEYSPLPISPDEGFPQSFRLAFAGRAYVVALYVNASERLLGTLPEEAVLELPQEEAHLVARIARESELPEPRVVFQRKLVPQLEYTAGDLALRFDELRVAKRNLNGHGSYGSRVSGGIALRWP